MQTFLMCPPRYFSVDYVINPWMIGNQGLVDPEMATRQWEAFYEALQKRASIKLIEPVSGLPDMVFTANAGLVRGSEFITASFYHPQRQPESAHFRRYFEDSGYRVRQLPDSVSFEGAGDALFDASGRLWVASGFRSAPSAADYIAAMLGLETVKLKLVDPRWYHLDTAFCPLADGHVLAYAEAFSADSRAAIDRLLGKRVIWSSSEDALGFACNAVTVGNCVILHHASDSLKRKLGQCGFEVIETNVSEFIKAGGACKCLTLEL